jgi:NAD(P)H-dependent flavin oxidoreductase YrpB (nitropropane dioxygenase family)
VQIQINEAMPDSVLKITNRFTQALKCLYPIVLSPMGGISGSKLAAAVSNAGGIGFIGTGGQNPNAGIRYVAIGEINSRFRHAQHEADPNTLGIGLTVENMLEKDATLLDQGNIARFLPISTSR